jgi:Cdc6-like AAA superfamily ATPase
MVKMVENGFDKVLEDAGNRYETNKEEYPQDWKQMTPFQLTHQLHEEIQTLENVRNNKEAYQELLDIINVALMLGVRLNQCGYGRDSSDS